MSWEEEYRRRTPKARGLFERASGVLPGGVSYAVRDIPPYPFYVDRAEGSRLYDVDGNAYTDYWLGHGALILGHAPRRVVEAVKRQVERGFHYGFSHPLEVELAELIVDMVPSAEMLRYTNSGTEANMYAVRLARSYTGRMRVAKFEGGWHGGYDALHKAVYYPFTEPESAGLDPKGQENTSVLSFNDLEGARRVIESEALACLIVEPMMGAGGFIPPEPGFLEGLRELCDGSGTLLIFDEVITGFRLAPGGAQELFGVEPDITTLGKIVGGGFPVGALCGRAEAFDHINHRKYSTPSQRSFHGGTFTGNPITMVAGMETLRELKEGEVYGHLGRLGRRAREGLVDVFDRCGTEAAVTGLESMFAIHFQKERPRSPRDAARNDVKMANALYTFMLTRGVAYMSPRLPHMFLCSAHADRDIEHLLSAAEEFCRKMAL